MTTPTDDTSSPMLAAAETLIASRVEAIRPLAAALAERNRIKGLLDAAEKSYGTAYASAEGAGWTPDELRQMGAEEPTRRPQGRPKGSRTRRRTSTEAPSTRADAPSSTSEQSASEN